MGCTISQLDGSKSEEYLIEKKILDDYLEPDTALQNRTITRFAAPLDPSENCCAFCEYDDEFREIRSARTVSMDTLSTLATVLNVSAFPVTIDSPYNVDEEFEMSHSAIISAGRTSSSRNLMPDGYVEAINHGEEHSVTSRISDDGIISASPSGAVAEAYPIDQPPNTGLSIPTHNSFLDGFSAPLKPNFGGSTIAKRLSLRKANAMSEYADKLHNIESTNCTPYTGGMLKSATSGISDERTTMTESILATENAAGKSKRRLSRTSLRGLQNDSDDTCDGEADGNDLPHHISLGKLHLPPASTTSIQHLQTRIPFANLSESCKKEMEMADSPTPAREKRLSTRIYPKKSSLIIEDFPTNSAVKRGVAHESRESVKTSVDKIEAMSKEMRLPLSPLKINTSFRSGPGLQQTSRLSALQPLSATKFAPRNIPSMGRNGPTKGEVFVGGRDCSQMSPKEKSVKEIVEIIQKPSPRNMNQYFTPVNRQRRSPSNASKSIGITPESQPVKGDDGEDSNISSETSEAKTLRLRKSVMSIVARTDYTAGPRPPANTVKNFYFTPSKEVDIFSVTSCEPKNVKRSIEAWQANSPISSAPGTPTGTPTPSQRFPDGILGFVHRVQ